jgi:hypothetical protein
MKTAKCMFLLLALLLAGCNSTPKSNSTPSLRSYNGTAAVGDFLTISIDSAAQTITYKNYTNDETGTVSYAVNADGTYSINDPDGNLLSAYEIPGSMLMIEAANAGPNRNAVSLITAIESVPASINTFAGTNFNYVQFRTAAGGVELGTISIDASGDITHAGYWPFGNLQQPIAPFNAGSFSASSFTEDPSGNFFTLSESSGTDYAFGTQNGFFAVDTGSGTILGLPRAVSKSFDASVAGPYKAVFYEKANAQTGQNNAESGAPLEGTATLTITAAGAVTITDNHGATMATGTLAAVADTPYLYDGTSNTLPDPLYGMFTFRSTTANSQQDVFVAFQNGAVIFSSFQTALPLVPYGAYTYFYGVGLQ